ncbi:GNAT family N-acetyltransferase [Cohnella sp. REN36]|uniref:GNAT family N-acetyltransferase n=1 Tax=Cohnella sp. REN36 TaxID=2887347 RepID=UPI001D14B1BF|nr:GNAT family N-acetyltransferase [Cohnella sp. REN36]MCC3375254.1 GNAT family N-acetyltransferase [Cohnella sp. REN36]
MTVEIRLVRQEEMKSAIDAADAIFRAPGMSSMGTAFPFIFSEAVSHSHGLFENSKLLAFMGLVPANVRIGSASLTVFSLGSVYCMEEARNRGYSSRVLDEIQAYGRTAGASLLLVSGDGPLYARSGCLKFGEVYRFALDRAFAESWRNRLSDIQVTEAIHRDTPLLHRLASARRFAYEMSLWDFSALIRTEANISSRKMTQRVYVANRNGNPAAFAVVALPGPSSQGASPVIVEWAGEIGAFLQIASNVMLGAGLEQLTLTAEGYEKELLQALRDVPMEKRRNQGTVYVFDAETLFVQLKPYFEEIDPIAGRHLSVKNGENGRAIISLPTLHDVELSREAFVSLLFDPQPDLPLSAEWSQAAAKWFPLPFPYTDSLNFV